MSYQVLARKWRPRKFAEMVGQEHVLRALINALDNDRLHHAYLFTGTRGVGKTTVARIFAKSLNCESGVSAEPCGTCSACKEIDEGRFVALIEEGIHLRQILNDTGDPELVQAEIHVLGGLMAGTEEAFDASRLVPVLNSLDEIHDWRAYCRQLENPLPCDLHADTGMGRLGLPAGEVDKLVKELGIPMRRQPSNIEHIALEDGHSEFLMAVAGHHVKSQDDCDKIMSGAHKTWAINKMWLGTMADTMARMPNK